ncbi:hypothetical protein DRP53_10790 [candidate division WOR-3 bacterium]|uniref:Uncharacterized protein n=1 Tax=candidate division WOR-3 bacterium TaxID=2052148 RepID=A0A660SC54_UNCW3|nr:MAG: hypothetical protein DRP53_10790 [candidate division WOR-3 bacterium]
MARIIAIIAIITASLYGMVEVYNVDVYENLHDSLQYDKVEQSFVATCDSIVRLEAFVGKEFGGGFYYLGIFEGGNEIGRITVDDSGIGWRWIGGDLQNPAAVTKGKTYTFRFWHSGFSGLSRSSCFSGLI